MNKKMLILFSILSIILIISIVLFSYAHTLKDDSNKSKDNPETEQTNNVHNLEKDDEKEQEAEKNDKNESYTQQKEETDSSVQSNTQQGSAGGNSSSSNSSSSGSFQNNNPKVEGTNSKNPENNNQVDKDEKVWNEFKSNPVTLMILESDKPDWETKSEQEEEAQKWINLGYRVEEPFTCIDLSSGRKCLYSLLVYLPKGVCNETSEEISINWRQKNYIGIVSYAKSLGYSCEGYQD